MKSNTSIKKEVKKYLRKGYGEVYNIPNINRIAGKIKKKRRSY